MVFTQLLLNGLIAGAIYSLVAAGFSLIYSTNKFIDLSHGIVIAVGAYGLFHFFESLSLGIGLSIILAILLAVVFGLILNILVYKPLRVRMASSVILLIASLGVLFFTEALIQMIFGASIKTIGYIEVAKGIEIFDGVITPLQILIIVVSVVLFIGLLIFMKKTKTGIAMRAVADNPEVSEIVGISTETIYTKTIIIASFIGGIAGVLIALEQNLVPGMGFTLIIKGFIGAVIGGIGSVPGAILGSFLLGLVENFGIWYLPSGYKDAIAFVLLVAFLLFRPQGILGIKKVGVK